MPEGAEGTGKAQLDASRFDLTSRVATDLRFGIHASASWLLDWARVLSPAIPPDENPVGAVQGRFTEIPSTPTQAAFWAGTLQGDVTGLLPWQKAGETPARYEFALTGSPSGLELAPVNLAAAAEPPLAFSGSGNATGYSLRLVGVASPEHIRLLASRLPPFGSGLGAVLSPPAAPSTATSLSQRFDLTCTRSWSAPEQTCTSGHTPEPASRPRFPLRRRR